MMEIDGKILKGGGAFWYRLNLALLILHSLLLGEVRTRDLTEGSP